MTKIVSEICDCILTIFCFIYMCETKSFRQLLSNDAMKTHAKYDVDVKNQEIQYNKSEHQNSTTVFDKRGEDKKEYSDKFRENIIQNSTSDYNSLKSNQSFYTKPLANLLKTTVFNRIPKTLSGKHIYDNFDVFRDLKNQTGNTKTSKLIAIFNKNITSALTKYLDLQTAKAIVTENTLQNIDSFTFNASSFVTISPTSNVVIETEPLIQTNDSGEYYRTSFGEDLNKSSDVTRSKVIPSPHLTALDEELSETEREVFISLLQTVLDEELSRIEHEIMASPHPTVLDKELSRTEHEVITFPHSTVLDDMPLGSNHEMVTSLNSIVIDKELRGIKNKVIISPQSTVLDEGLPEGQEGITSSHPTVLDDKSAESEHEMVTSLQPIMTEEELPGTEQEVITLPRPTVLDEELHEADYSVLLNSTNLNESNASSETDIDINDLDLSTSSYLNTDSSVFSSIDNYTRINIWTIGNSSNPEALNTTPANDSLPIVVINQTSSESLGSVVENILNDTSDDHDDNSVCSVCQNCTNGYIDHVISDVTSNLPSFLELPNRQGRFQLYHGKLFGVNTLKRSEPVVVACQSTYNYAVMVPLQMTNAKAFYKWQVEMPLRTLYGDLNVTIANTECRVFYSHNKGSSLVENLKITALDGIETEVSGLGPLNAIFASVTRSMISMFRRSIARTIENTLVHVINKELQDVKKYEEYYGVQK